MRDKALEGIEKNSKKKLPITELQKHILLSINRKHSQNENYKINNSIYLAVPALKRASNLQTTLEN